MKKRVDLFQVTDAENRLTQLGHTCPISCSMQATPQVGIKTQRERWREWSWCCIVWQHIHQNTPKQDFAISIRVVYKPFIVWFIYVFSFWWYLISKSCLADRSKEGAMGKNNANKECSSIDGLIYKEKNAKHLFCWLSQNTTQSFELYLHCSNLCNYLPTND